MLSKTAKSQRTQIEDLSAFGEELAEEQLRLVCGGMRISSYCAASSTYYGGYGDVDYYHCD